MWCEFWIHCCAACFAAVLSLELWCCLRRVSAGMHNLTACKGCCRSSPVVLLMLLAETAVSTELAVCMLSNSLLCCCCLCKGFFAAWVMLAADGLSLPDAAARGDTLLLCPCSAAISCIAHAWQLLCSCYTLPNCLHVASHPAWAVTLGSCYTLPIFCLGKRPCGREFVKVVQ